MVLFLASFSANNPFSTSDLIAPPSFAWAQSTGHFPNKYIVQHTEKSEQKTKTKQKTKNKKQKTKNKTN